MRARALVITVISQRVARARRGEVGRKDGLGNWCQTAALMRQVDGFCSDWPSIHRQIIMFVKHL